jgi:hypothetical protein
MVKAQAEQPGLMIPQRMASAGAARGEPTAPIQDLAMAAEVDFMVVVVAEARVTVVQVVEVQFV